MPDHARQFMYVVGGVEILAGILSQSVPGGGA